MSKANASFTFAGMGRKRKVTMLMVLLAAATLCGCVKPIGPSIYNPASEVFKTTPIKPVAEKTAPMNDWERVRASYSRLFTKSNGTLIESLSDPVTRLHRDSAPPAEVLQTPLVKKFLDAQSNALLLAEGGTPTEVITFTPEDFVDFREKALPLLTNKPWKSSDQGVPLSLVETNGFIMLFQKYLGAYVHGRFVDRNGNSFSVPKVSKSGVGNDTVVGFIRVAFEAMNDSFNELPIFYKESGDKKEWLNSGGQKPTYAVVTENIQNIAQVAQIDEVEIHAIQFFAGVAAEESETLSGLILRSFGDLEVGFVIGGHFSVGDNETLARMSDAFFNTLSYRLTEALAFHYFFNHGPGDYGPALADLIDFLKKLYKTIQE